MTTIPDDMVERVADAIRHVNSASEGLTFSELTREMAHAAIEAMQPAILAERERCARIAEMHDIRGDIAVAIRSQS